MIPHAHVRAAASAAVLLLVASSPPVDDAEARDLARLQGVWKLDSQVINGVRSPDSKTKSWVLVFEGNVYNPGSLRTSVEYTVRLDPTRNPKAIDFIPRESGRRFRPLRGVYSLTETTFTICRVLDPDLDRPAAIDSPPDSGLVVITWKR